MKRHRARARLMPASSLIPGNRNVEAPLSNIRNDQVVNITVGSDADEDDHISISMMLPTQGGGLSEYEETILLDEEAPHYLQEASHKFWDACVRAIRERVVEKVRTCGNCLGNCCYEFEFVYVSQADVYRMRDGGIEVEKYVDKFPEGVQTLRGFVGIMKKADLVHPISGETVSACPAFDGTKCTIYDHRPAICSEYSMVGCDRYEARP